MKNKLFKQIGLLTTILTSSLVLGSCQDEEVFDISSTDNGSSDFPYTYKLTLIPDTTQTRATSYEWNDGDMVFITFSTNNGTILGKATYQAESNDWNLEAGEITAESNGYSCGLAFYDGLPTDSVKAEDDGWRAKVNQFTNIYSSGWKTYYLNADEEGNIKNILISATLNHIYRVRFEGEPGTVITLDNTYTNYHYNVNYESKIYYHGTNNWTTDSFEQISIQEDGLSPYVYLNYIDSDTTSVMAVNINGDVFARPFYSSMFYDGKNSKVISLPSSGKMNGWNSFRPLGEFVYLLDEKTKNASVYRYTGDASVTEVTIKDKVAYNRADYAVTSIGENIFYNNQTIEKVTLPNSIERIGNAAFQYCYSLKEVNMPSTLVGIGNQAFYDCNNLTSKITLPSTIRSIGSECFWNCSSIPELTLPEGLLEMGSYAFYNCFSVKSVTIPSTLKRLEHMTFGECHSLAEVKFANKGLEYIDCYSLAYTALTDVVIPEGVKTIEYRAFQGTSTLESIDLPSTITNLGDNLFYNYGNGSSLSSITLRAINLPQTNDGAFNDVDFENCTLYVHNAKIEAYKNTSPFNQFANIEAIPGTEGEEITAGEAVDLGLPSGTLWADRNIGALNAEGRGDYFAWGETETKSQFNWENYKFGTRYELTKYCSDSYYGNVDNLNTLEAEDDAATANWGDGWRMPTQQEMQELINNCTWTWTTQNGVYGYLVTGRNKNSIFLPEEGRNGDSEHYTDYWSSNGNNIWANYLVFYYYDDNNRGIWMTDSDRATRRIIRPVKSAN